MAINTSGIAISLLVAASLSLAASTRAHAQDAGSCDLSQRTGPISLLILPSKEKVRSYAATLKGATVARQDATTVVMTDGRVITSDVAKASDHLNALGWGSRNIQVVASFRMRTGWRPSGFG